MVEKYATRGLIEKIFHLHWEVFHTPKPPRKDSGSIRNAKGAIIMMTMALLQTKIIRVVLGPNPNPNFYFLLLQFWSIKLHSSYNYNWMLFIKKIIKWNVFVDTEGICWQVQQDSSVCHFTWSHIQCTGLSNVKYKDIEKPSLTQPFHSC